MDPDGHVQRCADGDLGGGCGSDGPNYYLSDPEVKKAKQITAIKNYLWEHIPTAVALSEGASNQDGTPLIDPISKRPVTYEESSAGVI